LGARTCAGPVIFSYHGIALGSSELVGHLAPEGVHSHSLWLFQADGRVHLRAHKNSAIGYREPFDADLLHHPLKSRNLPRVQAPSNHVIEGYHAVSLSAAKVGLQLHNRIAPNAREPFQAEHEEMFQALCDICPAEELPGIAIFILGIARHHLGEVGGELCLTVSACCHVGMGYGSIPPGLQPDLSVCFCDDLCALPQLPLSLLLETLAHHLPGTGLDFSGLGCGDHLQQPLHGVECPVGVFCGESLLMSPFVPDLPEF